MDSLKSSTKVKDDLWLHPSHLTVLYFIANGPKYGNQIIQLLRTRNYQEWLDVKPSAIYHSLYALEKRGLITAQTESSSTQGTKRIYSITPLGQKIYKHHIFRCLSNPPRPKTLFDLGILAMTTLPRKQVLEALHIHRTTLNQRLNYLQSIVDTLTNIETIRKTDPARLVGRTPVSKIPRQNLGIIHALFDRPCQILQAEIQWINTFIHQIKINPNFPGTSIRDPEVDSNV